MRRDIGIVPHEREIVPALAGPFVHAAGYVVGAADFEEDGAGVVGFVLGYASIGLDTVASADGVRP